MSGRTLILGVDPGFTGALALYCLEKKSLVQVWDMPLTIAFEKKKEISMYDLSFYLREFRDHIHAAVVEHVSAAPGQGVVSMFNFGYGAGLISGVIAAHFIPIHRVRPSVWKALLGLTSEKAKSRDLAKETFPTFAASFARPKDDGRAEAALLAKFGERLYQMKEKHL